MNADVTGLRIRRKMTLRLGEDPTDAMGPVLDFAKIEAGRMDWSITELDPVSLVESAAASVAPMFQEKHVDFVLDLPPEAPPVVGDPDRLTEVIINLLSNAQKFVPENKGRVCVSMDVGQSEVTISVADDGRGIPLEKQDEIFQAFRQVVSEDGSHPSGTGLGLAISKKIVNHLGGRIWVDSTPHEGATFRFSVPLRH